MTTPLLEARDLVFDYPGFRALHGVSLVLEKASVTALVGPNGAGKTTLLRCLAALDTPLSGSVQLQGIDVHESPRDAHRLMGYLSDRFGLYEDLTVEQGLTYAARSQGLPALAVKQATVSTAERMGLLPKLKATAKTLSRGQRQRLAIGQAIIHNPRMLLLDEPASGLDPEARASLASVFTQLQTAGMTLLVSSHILSELEAYSTHMLAMSEGRLLEHRSIKPTSNPDQTRRLRLSFLTPSDATPRWLGAQQGVSVGDVSGAHIEITFTGDLRAQAAFVAQCAALDQGLLAVAPVAESLEASYLRTLKQQRTNLHQQAAS